MSFARKTAIAAALICVVGIASAVDAPDARPLKYEAPLSLTGTIYDQTATNVLFTFKRTATRTGTNLRVLSEYAYPDGKIAVRETLAYVGNQLASYALDDLQAGRKGGATIYAGPSNSVAGKIEFTYVVANGKLEKATEALTPDTLTSDMIGPFLTEHWKELMDGREIKCRYLVIPRRETVGFIFVKNAETSWRGKPVVVISMKPTSWVIGLAVDPLVFIAEKNGSHHVLQYTGRTIPRIKFKEGWKGLNAVTVFDWK